MSANLVASHYNELNEAGLEKRLESSILYQRNLNNWIKSVVIALCLSNIRKGKEYNKRNDINVLDLGAGKGGDLLKWKKGNIRHITCIDIAKVSVEQCQARFDDMLKRSKYDRYSMPKAIFKVADCTEELKFEGVNEFDVTSSQFCLHYSFESQRQAETFLSNACSNLKPGGFYIGTTTDACQMIKRLRESEDMSFGNDVYKIKFHLEDKENIPLFGTKYDFYLEGVVNCPEYLVYFPLLQKMLEKHNMKLVYCQNFGDFFKEHSQHVANKMLLERMKAQETYPPPTGVKLMRNEADAYAHAHQFLQLNPTSKHIGTLSAPEWEATTLYLAFAFQKCS